MHATTFQDPHDSTPLIKAEGLIAALEIFQRLASAAKGKGSKDICDTLRHAPNRGVAGLLVNVALAHLHVAQPSIILVTEQSTRRRLTICGPCLCAFQEEVNMCCD